MQPQTPPYQPIIRPQEVEFRLLTVGGVRIIHCYFNTPEPRFSAYAVEVRSGKISPITLTLPELGDLIARARTLLGL